MREILLHKFWPANVVANFKTTDRYDGSIERSKYFLGDTDILIIEICTFIDFRAKNFDPPLWSQILN